MNALVSVDNTEARAFIREKIKLHQMQKEKIHEFSYDKNMANFEAFRWGIKLRINFLFLKSGFHGKILAETITL